MAGEPVRISLKEKLCLLKLAQGCRLYEMSFKEVELLMRDIIKLTKGLTKPKWTT